VANLNKVFLMGNLTRDPELRYTPNGAPVADFGLAINREWKGQDGEKRKETCFVDVTFFGRTAETVGKYLRKGRPMFLEGRLKFDSWTGQDGTKRSKLSVVGENFQFLGPPPGASGQGPASGPPANEQEDDIPF